MNKKITFARNGALFLGLGALFLNAFKQLQQMRENPDLKFDWGAFLLSGAKGATIGGFGGFLIGAIADEQNKMVEPVNTDAHLKDLATIIRSDSNSWEYRVAVKKCDKVIDFIQRKFGPSLSGMPFIWGSCAKGTALRDCSDYDLLVRFQRSSYKSLEAMYEATYEVLNQFQDQSLVQVRRQGKSIGLLFEHRLGNYRIDVVPQRDTNENPRDTSGYLYLNPSSPFGRPSYTKTDIGLQQRERLTATQKELVVILKHWRTENELPIKSYLLEQFVKRAFKAHNRNIPSKITGKLMMVIHFIYDNIETITIRSIENTNNILTDIPDSDKSKIKRACKHVIDEVRYQPNSIEQIFSVSDVESAIV